MTLGMLGGFALAVAITIGVPAIVTPAPFLVGFLLGFSLTLLGGLIGKAAS